MVFKKIFAFTSCALGLVGCSKHDPILPGVRHDIFDSFEVNVRNKDVPELNGGEKKENKAILSGRFGGEICQVLIFTGELNSGNSVLFHAIVPSAWFNTYTQFLEDILDSLQ